MPSCLADECAGDRQGCDLDDFHHGKDSGDDVGLVVGEPRRNCEFGNNDCGSHDNCQRSEDLVCIPIDKVRKSIKICEIKPIFSVDGTGMQTRPKTGAMQMHIAPQLRSLR